MEHTQESQKVGGQLYKQRLENTDFTKWQESLQNTIMAKFGVDNISQLDAIKEKKRETCLEHYGVESPLQSDIVKEKVKNTCLEVYGTESPMQNEEVKNRGKRTNLERYGTENVFASEEIKRQIKTKLMNEHGVEYSSQIPESREKTKETWMKNYGVDHPTKDPEIRTQIEQTNLERYGTIYPAQNEAIKEKTKHTNIARYGVPYIMQVKSIVDSIDWLALVKKRHETMKKNGTYGKSKAEDGFYDLLCSHFSEVERQYSVNGWPMDFYVPALDLCVQFDGIYWHGLDRPTEEITEFESPRDRVIYEHFLTDSKQNSWFSKNNKNLIRITDLYCETHSETRIIEIIKQAKGVKRYYA